MRRRRRREERCEAEKTRWEDGSMYECTVTLVTDVGWRVHQQLTTLRMCAEWSLSTEIGGPTQHLKGSDVAGTWAWILGHLGCNLADGGGQANCTLLRLPISWAVYSIGCGI